MIPKPKKEKRKRHKQTIACDISPSVRKVVEERDGGVCVICRQRRGKPNCHYIGRGQGGLGIEQNIVTACEQCHHDYDNGNKGERDEIRERIESYLRSHYPFWEKSELIYNKFDYLDPRWLMGN
jgi:5-methylcytosine-specific restriction endonuclease McrA